MEKAFWCTVPGCSRSKPFPRKDKLASHVKAMHSHAHPLNLPTAGLLDSSGLLNPNGITFEDLSVTNERVRTGEPAAVDLPSSACEPAYADIYSVYAQAEIMCSGSISGQINFDGSGDINAYTGVGSLVDANSTSTFNRPGNDGPAGISGLWSLEELTAGSRFASIGESINANGHFTANGPGGFDELLVDYNGSTSMSEYLGVEAPNNTAGVGSIDKFINFGELAGFDEPFAMSTAASVFGGTNGLTGLGTTWDANMLVAVDNSLCMNYPAVSASNTSDVDGVCGINDFTNADDFGWSGGPVNMGATSQFSSSVYVEGHAIGVGHGDDDATDSGAASVAFGGFDFAYGFREHAHEH